MFLQDKERKNLPKKKFFKNRKKSLTNKKSCDIILLQGKGNGSLPHNRTNGGAIYDYYY